MLQAAAVLSCYLATLQPAFFIISWGGVRLSPLGMSATNWPLVQPRIVDEYRAFGGMRIVRGNRSTQTKHTPVSLYPPQVPPDLTWGRTRAAAVGRLRLTA
jgi:hypothetical protein